MKQALNGQAKAAPPAVEVIAPRGAALDGVMSQAPWPPFDEEAMAFVAAVSGAILKGEAHRQFPELIAFAYEMRGPKLKAIKEKLKPSTTGGVLRGRGLALHFAPANVDTIFLYSFMLSLLAGNANIVRVSGKPSPQVDLIVETLNETMQRPDFARVARRVAIVRFDHNPDITRHLSAQADLRIIWGGDTTIETIRAAPIAPLARDVAFPDRWSLAVLDAAAVLAAPDSQRELARQFANDAYWFAQMACSSPRLIVWRGAPEAAHAAAALFFALLDEEAQRHARFITPVDYVNKRIFEDEMAMRTHATVRQAPSNLVSVVTVPQDEVALRAQFCGGGAFISTQIETLEQLSALLERRVQTVVSYGIAASDWAAYLAQPDVPGIDRIVPPGRALAFEFVWDGMDLLREFTRETTISVS